MNKTFLLTIILLLSFSQMKASGWLNSLEDAQKMALATNKLVLVDFWATWCGPCKRMDSESWSNEEVQTLMANYVPVKIDIDIKHSLAQKYGVNSIPNIFIMDGNGKILYHQNAYKTKNQVMHLLKKYALSTAFLKQEMLDFYQKENFVTSFRLASKYQDYSLYITDSQLKNNILTVSDTYFNDAKDYLKNSDLKNKAMFEQKLELYEIQEYLIVNNPNKALRKLDKMERSKIQKLNESFYSFLYYTAYKQMQNDNNANLWKDKLTVYDIEKSKLFMKFE